MLEEDFYDVLGVNREFNITEIKRSYRKLALVAHPDKVEADMREIATLRFPKIRDAYAVLSDPVKKQEYDKQLDSKYKNMTTEERSKSDEFRAKREIKENKNYRNTKKYNNNIKQFNDEQKRAFEMMKSNKHTFVTGVITSQNFLLETFIAYCKTRKIKIRIFDFLISTTDVGTVLKNIKKIIITNTESLSLEKIEYYFSLANVNNIQIIFFGDFYQLSTSKNAIFLSHSWKTGIHQQVNLQEEVGQVDTLFQQLLCKIQKGDINDVIPVLASHINKVIGINQIIPTKLFSHIPLQEIDKVEKINRDNLEKLTTVSKLHVFNSKDTINAREINDICPLVESLQLCIGCQVMLTYTYNDLPSGSRGVVIGFNYNFPIVRFMNNMEIRIMPIKYNFILHKNKKIKGYREQIPLMLAFAVSIYKCPGLLDCAQIDLGATLTEPGQAYKTLLKLRSLESFSIVTFHHEKITCLSEVKQYYESL